MSINRVNISGNLTRDSELRQTQSGTAILRFGVAVNDRRKNNQTGEWEDYPNFIDCVMWGNRANALANYLKRGTKVALEGRLHWSSWEKDGVKRSKVEVYVDEVEFLSSRNTQQQSSQQAYAPQQPAYSTPAPASAGAPAPQQAPAPVSAPPTDNVYDEDIPF